MGGTDAQPRPEGRTSLATLARFYLSCIEAEQAAALALPLGGNYVEAGAGFMEAGTGVPIADDPDVATLVRETLPGRSRRHGGPRLAGVRGAGPAIPPTVGRPSAHRRRPRGTGGR